MSTAAHEDEPPAWPASDLEPAIRGLRNTIGIMDHMANSPSEVEADEWTTLANVLTGYAKQIEELWQAAFARHIADRDARRAALAAVEAKKAAPGSKEDVERAATMWTLLCALTETAARRCAEAGFPSFPPLHQRQDHRVAKKTAARRRKS
jgi:hypothetical protein